MSQNLSETPLANLAKGVNSLILQGRWSIFEISDTTHPAAKFLILTDENDKFLVAQNGDLVFHSADYPVPAESKRARLPGSDERFSNLMRRFA